MVPKNKVVIHISVKVHKEGKQYASWCPELGVASCGNTRERACKNLDEAIDLYLETLAEVGELTRVLEERGLKLFQKKEACKQSTLSSRRKTVTVPECSRPPLVLKNEMIMS